MKLGKLKPVNLRDVWKHEALDFTNWMAKTENVDYINEVIGLSLIDVETEVNVGAYKCDIVAKDEFSNKTVIIENQLENTNHDHLGKIITYASGLDASVIIWIVKKARSEHSSAIEWLNNHTDEDISFFLLEAKLWKIENSSPALQFKMIEAPNDFNKSVRTNKAKSSISQTEQGRLKFWTLFNEVMEERGEFNIRKPSTDHWYDFSIGTSRCYLNVDLLSREKKVRVNMFIPDDKEIFDLFLENRTQIESSVGIKLQWDRLNDKKASRIYTYINNFSLDDKEDNHIQLSNEIIDMLIKFRKAFKLYI